MIKILLVFSQILAVLLSSGQAFHVERQPLSHAKRRLGFSSRGHMTVLYSRDWIDEVEYVDDEEDEIGRAHV